MHRTQDFNIRYLKPKDYSYIVEISRKLVDTVLSGKPFNESKIRQMFDNALENEKFAGIVLVNSDDIAKGFILGSIDEPYFHDMKIAVCLTIWVDPEARAHSLDMIRAFEAWAKYKNAEKVVLSAFTGLSPSNFNKVLSRFNYKPQETVHWKDI